MRRPLGSGELVHVERLLADQAPAQFTWRGSRHQVRQVERCKKVDQGRQSMDFRPVYQLRTTSGLHCKLSLDPLTSIWRMEQVLPG